MPEPTATPTQPSATPSTPVSGEPVATPTSQPQPTTPEPQPTAPQPTQPAQPTRVPDVNSNFEVPEQYKDKGWAKKVNSVDDLFKQVDNLDSLIGKKTAVPDWDKATPQEIENFFNTMRPSKAEDYNLKEGLFPGEEAVFKGMMHKAGLYPKQAEIIADVYNEYMTAEKTKMFSQDGFKAAMVESFGNEYEGVVKDTTLFMKKNLNEADMKLLDSLPNSSLALVYRLANNVSKAYGAKEGDSHVNGPEATANPPQDVGKERLKIINELNNLKFRPHKQSEVDELTNKLNSLNFKKPSTRRI